MVKEFLKIAGVKTQAEFYKKYPSEEAFFRAHPEAQQLVHQKMAYGGGMYAYAPGGPILPGTMSKAIADYKQSQGEPVVGADGMTNFIRRPQDAAPVAAPSAGAGQQHFALNPYQGVSVYDMLEAQGKAGDYNSRKGLAKTLGIPNYRGLPNQNALMMEMIRQNPDILLNYTGAPAPTKRSTKRAANGNALSGYSEDEIAAARAANPALFETDGERQARQNPFIMAPGQPAVDTPRSLKDYLPQLGRGKGYEKASDEYIANDPYFFADEGDNAFIKAIDAPFTWGRNQAAKLVMDGDLMAGAKVVGAGAGVGLLGRAYDYFKPRYEPYTPPNKQLPGAGPIAGQRALPAPQKQLPPSTPRGWTMGEGAYRSPNYPFHAQGGQPCYNCGGGMYADGGENDYSGTYSNGVYYGAGGTYIPMPMQPGDPLPQYMYGMRNGGLVKGSVHDMSEAQIQDLINQGYKIQYV
jgi:hypothetical protein